jgi:sec-independent protein translocase protein TatC
MARDDRNSSARGEGAIMPFGDHLEELRRRVMLALAVPIPLAVLVFLVADRVRAILIAPLLEALAANGLPQHLQALSPTETMAVDIKLAFVTAIVLSAPWILWQAWKFIEPGLYEHERRFARLLIPGSIALVLAGIATLYWVLLPFSLQVLVAYGMDTPPPPPAWVAAAGPDAGTGGIPTVTESPAEVRPGQAWIKLPERTLCVAIDPGGGLPAEVLTVPLARGGGAYIQEYRLGEYISFVLLMMLGIAIAYQTPLVILLLGWVGIVRPETLSRNRRYALLIIAIVAAVVTPTSDLLSMSLMMVPLYLLYELGILLLKIAPPSAVGEGTVFRGFWRRMRSRGEA